MTKISAALSKCATIACALSLMMVAGSQHLLAQNTTLTIGLGSQETLWLDANNCSAAGPRGAWLSFTINNTGSVAATGVQVTFAGFTGTTGGLVQPSYFVPTSDLTRNYSTIAAGAEQPAYFYVDYSAVCLHSLGGGNPYQGYTANYTVTVTASNISAPVVRSSAVTTDDLLTASAAGQALTSTVGPGFYVGQLLTQTVSYSFGNNTNLFFQPAGEAAFDSGCIRLVASEITGVSGSVSTSLIGLKDALWFPTASVSGGGGNIDVTFTWRLRCVNATQTLHPWAAALSGQKYKYTGFASSTIFPPAQNSVTIAKTVSPNSLNDNTGGPVTWTVTFTNSAAVSVRVSQINDVIPSCMKIANPTASGSDVTAANSFTIPSVNSTGTQSWVGIDTGNTSSSTYQVPPSNGTLVLKYTTDISQCSYPASYTNSATGNVGSTTVGPAYATLALGGVPALSLLKTANPTTYNAVGQTITYTYTITNSGNVVLGPSQFTVSDDHLGSPLGTAFNCGSATTTLAVGATVSCTATHVITQADLDAGSITNTATASTVYSGSPVTSPPSSVKVTAQETKALTLSKTPNPTTYSTVGQTITYTYKITNSGNVTLGPAQFTVSDDHIGSPLGTPFNCGATTTLAPAAFVTCTSTYTITQADLDAGSVVNNASASGGGATSTVVTATVTATQTRSISLAKGALPTTYNAIGQIITYTYTITNTGNVTLGPAQFTVTDDHIGTFNCGSTVTIAPNGTLGCTAFYTITQADLLAGHVTNLATASGASLTSNTATATVNSTFVGNSDLSVTKSDASVAYFPGQNVSYTITVTNLGTTINLGFTITDTIPSNTTFVSAPGCTFNAGTGVVTCTSSGVLAVNGSTSFVVTVLPSGTRTGCLVNTATIGSNTTTDPNSANNSGTDTDVQLLTTPQSSGLGLALSYPLVGGNNTSATATYYSASSHVFQMNSTPATALFTATTSRIITGGSLAIRATVDNNGVLTGGITGDDFVLTGTVSYNGNTYTGTLLRGEIVRFGYQELGPTDRFQMQFVITGGTMASLYSGKDFGVTITAENSTFNNSFASDFSSTGKFSSGSVAQICAATF